MKSIHKIYFAALTVLIYVASGCVDHDYEDRRYQSVDSHGEAQNIISVAVTATGSAEFIAYSIPPSTESSDVILIPVVLNSKDLASEDIHVQMVPALDSLDSYNNTNGSSFVMPGDLGTPAFTLVDNGVVTIPAGSSVGYLKIKTVANDYFADQLYAYAYRIQSVQEPGYIISGNHNTGIAAVIGKNQYEGTYASTGTRYNFGSYTDYAGWDNVNDEATGTIVSTAPWSFNTKTFSRGLTTLAIHVANADGGFGYLNATVNPDNTVTIASSPETGVTNLAPLPGKTSTYDPDTKTFTLYYQYINTSGTARIMKDVLVAQF
jgi:hypothetical protein